NPKAPRSFYLVAPLAPGCVAGALVVAVAPPPPAAAGPLVLAPGLAVVDVFAAPPGVAAAPVLVGTSASAVGVFVVPVGAALAAPGPFAPSSPSIWSCTSSPTRTPPVSSALFQARPQSFRLSFPVAERPLTVCPTGFFTGGVC